MRSSGETRPVPSASDGTSGRPLEPGVAREPQHGARSDALLQIRGGRRCSIRAARRAASTRRAARRCALRGLHSGSVRRRDVPQIRQHRHGRVAALERRGVDERLERRSRLPPAARRRGCTCCARSSRRRPSRGCRRSADRSRPAPPRARDGAADRAPPPPRARPRPAASGRNVVWTCQSGGLSPPNSLRNCCRRYSFAQPPRVSLRLPVRLDARAHRARRLFLRRRDEPLLAHARQHDDGSARARRRSSTTATAPTARGSGRR